MTANVQLPGPGHGDEPRLPGTRLATSAPELSLCGQHA